ncbi:MAG: tetratricopeptide repeat protein [Pseudomonadota bacterium]
MSAYLAGNGGLGPRAAHADADDDTAILLALIEVSDASAGLRILSTLVEQQNEVPVDVLTRVLDRTASEPNNRQSVDGLNSLSRQFSDRGDAATGLDLAQRAATMAVSLGDEFRHADALYNASLALWYQSRVSEATRGIEHAINAYLQQDHTKRAARAFTLLGAIHRSQSDYGAAASAHENALSLSRRIGDASGIARSTNNLGLIDWKLGRLEQARVRMDAAVAHYRTEDNPGSLAAALSNLGLICVEQGQASEALAYINEGLSLDYVKSHPRKQALLLSNLGFAHANLGNRAEAFEYDRRALALREAIEDHWGMARSLGSLAALYIDDDDLNQAEHYLLRAIQAAETAGATDELVDAKSTLAELYHRQGKAAAAASLLRDLPALQRKALLLPALDKTLTANDALGNAGRWGWLPHRELMLSILLTATLVLLGGWLVAFRSKPH